MCLLWPQGVIVVIVEALKTVWLFQHLSHFKISIYTEHLYTWELVTFSWFVGWQVILDYRMGILFLKNIYLFGYTGS